MKQHRMHEDHEYMPEDLYPLALKRKLDREKRRRRNNERTGISYRRPDIHE